MSDPRMQMTLRDVEKFLVIPRRRALVIWKFPVLYPDWTVEELFDPIIYPIYPRSEACKNSTSAAATKTAPPPYE